MRITVSAEKCTGCNSCEMICSFEHEQSFNPALSRVKIVTLDYAGFSNPIVCLQCIHPKCVEACPTSALSKNVVGSIGVEAAKCDGCGLCIEACDFGAITYGEAKNLPLICDLCGGKYKCVEWCPTGALTLHKNEKTSRNKAVKLTISKAKKVLKDRGIPETVLKEYEKFA